MRLSDLQNKDIIDILTGEKIGNVIDAEISIETGNIVKLIIYEKRGIFNVVRQDETYITWKSIEKIGTDVILVNRKL